MGYGDRVRPDWYGRGQRALLDIVYDLSRANGADTFIYSACVQHRYATGTTNTHTGAANTVLGLVTAEHAGHEWTVNTAEGLVLWVLHRNVGR